MGQRIVVIGNQSEDLENLRQRLTEPAENTVVHFDSAAVAIQSLARESAHMLGFSLPLFDKEKTGLLYQFRDQGFDLPMLVYARAIAKDAYRAVENIPKAVLLESPCERKRLIGVVQKMIVGSSVKQQRHRRFLTDQTVQVEPYTPNATVVLGKIRNLSQGGAFVECDTKSLKVGDLIRFHISLSEVAKKHVVSAQIMWCAETGDGVGFGVAFMRSGDVYQNLLKRM